MPPSLDRSRDNGHRQKLINAALKQFAEKGYHNTRISEIVKYAGVSQGTFYWYFKSKELLALELIENGREQLIEVIRQGYRMKSGSVEDMVQSSARLFNDLFDFADRNRYLMALILIKGKGGDPAIQNAACQTIASIESSFKNNIKRAMDLDMLPRSLDLSMTAGILTGLITGVLSKWLFGPMYDVDYRSIYTSSQMAEETAKFEFYGLFFQSYPKHK